jgi:hypothetical protein
MSVQPRDVSRHASGWMRRRPATRQPPQATAALDARPAAPDRMIRWRLRGRAESVGLYGMIVLGFLLGSAVVYAAWCAALAFGRWVLLPPM